MPDSLCVCHFRYQCSGCHPWSTVGPSPEHLRFPVQELAVPGHWWGWSDTGHWLWGGAEADNKPSAQW